MRIWDVSAGYLARQQLLGEHRELHGLFNILAEGKKGYGRHPETLRWVDCLSALSQRHQELVAEMALRGYRHHSPLAHMQGEVCWPERYIDAPHRQFALLQSKYADGRSGRIPLPADTQALWAQHKYSVMARDPTLYAEIGPEVAHGLFRRDIEGLAMLLVQTLRRPPDAGRLYNALSICGDMSPGRRKRRQRWRPRPCSRPSAARSCASRTPTCCIPPPFRNWVSGCRPRPLDFALSGA